MSLRGSPKRKSPASCAGRSISSGPRLHRRGRCRRRSGDIGRLFHETRFGAEFLRRPNVLSTPGCDWTIGSSYRRVESLRPEEDAWGGCRTTPRSLSAPFRPRSFREGGLRKLYMVLALRISCAGGFRFESRFPHAPIQVRSEADASSVLRALFDRPANTELREGPTQRQCENLPRSTLSISSGMPG
jgi:hypothetical protein